MKILILLLLISFAANSAYMKTGDKGNCGKVKTYRRAIDCGLNCFKLSKKYNCVTFSDQTIEVDDFKKPKLSKSEVETCLGKEDCESDFENKLCSDTEEKVYISKVYDELYCSKLTGYQKKTINVYREDPVKKAADALTKKNISDQKKANKNRIKVLKNKVKNGTLTASEKDEVLKYLLRHLK